ncbi:MAG: dTMP kinase [Planctomycetota bacterium]|nr:dTMP kinase [Planctomycetota bacterium]
MVPPNATEWKSRLEGRFIVFDGPDGSGKSTQFRRFSTFAQSLAIVVEETREPGGTAIGEQIRNVLLDRENISMTVRCEMLLYMASRAQLVEQRIQPALARKSLVLADRFISSTLAYQGTAGGLSPAEIMDVGILATGGTMPDLVVIFDVDEVAAAKRLSPLLDRMEQKGIDFHRRVREGYLAQVRANPCGHLLIDATRDPNIVWNTLLEGLTWKLDEQNQRRCTSTQSTPEQPRPSEGCRSR